MTNTRRAVFLDHPSLDLGDLDLSPLRECFSDLQLFAQTLPEQVAERLQGATVAISNKILIDAAAMAANPDTRPPAPRRARWLHPVAGLHPGCR